MTTLNETHNPEQKSWVESANQDGCEFPIQNLPYAVFKRKGSAETFRPGVAIGDFVLDLNALAQMQPFEGKAARALSACAAANLNRLMALDPAHWSALRLALFQALSEGATQQKQLEPLLIEQRQVEYTVPAQIGDYTDFYISVHHATAVGSLFRPDNPLLPNYKWVPIGYHGRASSIGVSGTNFKRPSGQLRPAAEGEAPTVEASKRLDFELELGVFVGQGNAAGEPISLENAEGHVFGLCLFNDWSARDIQAWEYQPLGPFLAKNFASTVSPWVVTLEALEPFRTALKRDKDDPQPLPYLNSDFNQQKGAFDIQLDVFLTTETSRKQGHAPHKLASSNFNEAFWTLAQLVTHHTVNGCNLQAGDLLGTGTLSGPNAGQEGSLLELNQGGKKAIELSWGEQRYFLEDHDEIIFEARGVKEGYPTIGFGQCAAMVLPAHSKA